MKLHTLHIYFYLFIESSKTDQYRKGAVVPIVQTSTGLCPRANLVNYLSQVKLVLFASLNDGDDFLVENMITKSGPSLSKSAPRFHTPDVVKFCQKKLVDVVLDPKSFSWNGFRSGGASSAA